MALFRKRNERVMSCSPHRFTTNNHLNGLKICENWELGIHVVSSTKEFLGCAICLWGFVLSVIIQYNSQDKSPKTETNHTA